LPQDNQLSENKTEDLVGDRAKDEYIKQEKSQNYEKVLGLISEKLNKSAKKIKKEIVSDDLSMCSDSGPVKEEDGIENS
jgi:hypothetical protein